MGFGSAPFGSAPFGSSSFGDGETFGIVDIALNPLEAGSSAPMLGWVEPAPEAEALSQRIYDFLLETIRREDQINGKLFVKRFLEGPQTVWNETWDKIFAINTLYSADEIADEWLVYLQDSVGWVGSLKNITARLDAATLRRLIGVSARFWKRRGLEETITDTLRLLTGARMRSWNWFDYRWIVEETGLGHEQDGHDPWNISVANDREVNVRIVDDGSLDKELVREMTKLMRPTGERIEITYLSFLDLFETNADNSQWTPNVEVASGLAVVTDGGSGAEGYVTVDGATSWTSYTVSYRIRGLNWGVLFHHQDSLNAYGFKTLGGGLWSLFKRSAGVDVDLVTGGSVPPYSLIDNEWYLIRVQVIVDSGAVNIDVFVDGVHWASASDASSPWLAGSVGFLCSAGGEVSLDEVEVIPAPAFSDFIDINS